MASARLQITVESASNLYNADGILAGKSDPYVIVEVLGQETMKFQTQVISNDLNPMWNYTGEIAGFMDGDILQFTVMDKDTWKSDSYLGKACLVASDIYPNGFHAEIALEESKTNATLSVMVVILGYDEPGIEENTAVMVTGEENMQQIVECGFPTTQPLVYGAPQPASMPRTSQSSGLPIDAKVLQVIVHAPVTVTAEEFARTNGTIVSAPLPVTVTSENAETGIVETTESNTVKIVKKKKKSKGCC